LPGHERGAAIPRRELDQQGSGLMRGARCRSYCMAGIILSAMSTLRTICLVCAGYYLLQSLGFMFASATAGAVRGMMPESADAHPIVQLQGDIASVMTAFAPYLLIGVAVCLLMAWRLKPWWRAVPVLS